MFGFKQVRLGRAHRGTAAIATVVAVVATWAIATCPAPAMAGPNADGVLLVHYNSQQSVPPQAAFVDGQMGACASAVTQAPDGADPILWHVYAAFPPNASPRLKVVTFGCEFDQDHVGILWSVTRPGALQIFYPDQASWPYTGSGVAVGFQTTLTQTLDEVYCFAGYGDQAQTFRLRPHPDHGIGGSFADDAAPAHLDVITGYGYLGFGVAGSDPDTLCAAAAPAGACCRGADGSCVIVPETDCDPYTGDFYLGNGSACPGSTCSDFPGACCEVLVNGACRILTFDMCQQTGGLFWGFSTSCQPSPCPMLLGACCSGSVCRVTIQEDCTPPESEWVYQAPCVPDYCFGGACCQPNNGVCFIARYLDCLEQGNTWHGGTCDPNPCVQPAVCCYAETGTCLSHMGERECEESGGVFYPELVSCDPNPCLQPAQGACCNRENAICTVLEEHECLRLGSRWTYVGDGTDCVPNPCSADPGACCLVQVDGACELLTRAGCSERGGLWGGLDSQCAPQTCPDSLGACCLQFQICIVNLRDECEDIAGAQWTPFQPCTPDLCVERHACCTVWIDGECALVTRSQCAEHGGLFFPAVNSCDPDHNPCLSDSTLHLGACCIEAEQGVCRVLGSDQCNLLGGTWVANIPCSPGRCVPGLAGACCYVQPAGQCQIVSPGQCSDEGALYLGDGTICDPSPCPTGLGACCILSQVPGGLCVVTIQEECLPPHHWMGEEPCTPDLCGPLGSGACCLLTGECVVVGEADCWARRGLYMGNQVPCVPNPCESTPTKTTSWGRIKTMYR